MAKCRKYFATTDEWTACAGAWKQLMRCGSEDEFEESWSDFCREYRSKPVMIQYLDDTWVRHKEKLVSAWTDQHRHLGQNVTSWVEGAHAVLKKYLQCSSGDLCDFYRKVLLLLHNQHEEFTSAVASSRMRFPLHANLPVLRDLFYKVSPYCINRLKEQWDRIINATAQDPLPPCTGVFTRTMGLPCAHVLEARMAENQACLVQRHSNFSSVMLFRRNGIESNKI